MAGIYGAAGSFNVGNACALVIQHPLAPGGELRIPNVTGFKCSQETTQLNSVRLDGVNLSAKLPKGWRGTFMADRADARVDDLFVLIEALWYTQATMQQATVFQYVNELNNSVSTYQFVSCSLSFQDAGEWKGDAVVKQTIEFEAFRRLKV